MGKHGRHLLPLADRFWIRVLKTNSCWLWTGTIRSDGYGSLSIGVGERGNFNPHGAKMLAHRASWEVHFGSIPDGLHVCHHCDNPRCVRPDHLFLGTDADNLRDMAAKGRQVFQQHPEKVARGARHGSQTHPESRQHGEKRWSAKLSESDVREIRALHQEGVKLKVIAAKYDIHFMNVSAIANRRSWKHVI